MKKIISFVRSHGVKLSVMLGVACASFASFAEGPTASGNYDFSGVTTELTSLTTALKTWMTGALPIMLGVVGVFLVIWLAKLAVRAIKGLASSGK